MTAKLKPCPFCGGMGMLLQHPIELPNGTKDYMYSVHCTDRRCGGRTNRWFPESSAVAAWNRRVEVDK